MSHSLRHQCQKQGGWMSACERADFNLVYRRSAANAIMKNNYHALWLAHPCALQNAFIPSDARGWLRCHPAQKITGWMLT